MPNTDLDISLDGVHYRLRGPLAYSNLATLPPKVVIGDYSHDTNELMSAWVLTDLSGGHGVTDLGPADTNRFRFAQGIYARYPNQWTMPFRIWSTNEADGIYQPLCDGLTKFGAGTDVDWRQFSLIGRTIYVDHVDTNRQAFAKATNKGVVFQGNGSRPLLFIPHGDEGYSVYDPTGTTASPATIGTVYSFDSPTFHSFALLDDKLIGIDTKGVLYKSIRAIDTLDANLTNTSSESITIKVDAPDVKYSKGIELKLVTGSTVDTVTVTGINKADQTLTINRPSGNRHAHDKNDEILGVWYKYGGKCRMPAGTDIRDLVLYYDREGQPTVHIVTDRDVWALDDGGPRVFPTSLTFPQSPFAGIGTAVWRGDLYVSGGMDIYRYNGDVVSNIGLSRDDGLPRAFSGVVADLAAGPNGLYAVVRGQTIYNAATSRNADCWSVHEWNGSGWQTIWATSMDWGSATLNANVAAGDTEIVLTSNALFAYGDLIQIGSERMFVNGRKRNSATTILVRRGRYRTSVATHTSGATVWVQRLPTFIQVSLAEPERLRVYWGIGHSRYYQEQPSEATNPREDVETNTQIGFGRATKDGSNNTVYPTGTIYSLETGRFDANMAGYVKIANAVELRLRRLPPTQVLRLKYKTETDTAWKLLGTVAGGDQTTLNGNINSSTTSVTLTNVEFLAANMTLTVGSEVMLVTAVNTTTKVATVQRGYGSTAASHTSGDVVYVDFRIGTVQNGRNLFRFGTYATNNNVFTGTPFHLLEFRLEVTDQRGNVTKNAALASMLSSGVVTSAKVAEDDDLVTSLASTATPAADTFVIEHLSLSYLKLRSPSGSWIADIDLSQPWMDKSPEELAASLEGLLTAQKFIAFQHKDKTYRARVSQITGSDGVSDDERLTRRINIVEMPITLGPMGDW